MEHDMGPPRPAVRYLCTRVRHARRRTGGVWPRQDRNFFMAGYLPFREAPDRVPRAFGRTSSGLKNSSIYQTICQVLPVISSNPRSWDTSPKITPVRRAVRHVGRAYGRQGGSPPPLPRYRSPSRTDSRTPGAAPSCRLGQPGYDARTDGLAAGHSIPAEGSLVPAQGLRDAGLRRQRYVRNAS